MSVSRITLNQLSPGESAQICAFDQEILQDNYLMELGLIPGTAVTLIKTAPLGDPIEISFRNCRLAIRRSEARMIWVEKSQNLSE